MGLEFIDPTTGKVLFDAEAAIPEQLDPERDHIIAGPGWKVQTPEQCVNELIRNGSPTCPYCRSIVLTQDNGEFTCQSCQYVWPVSEKDV